MPEKSNEIEPSNKKDKRDYLVGDKANDGTIGEIFYSYQNYIIYRDKVDYSIIFEANKPSIVHKKAYILLKQLRNDATMYLTKRRQEAIDKMLINSLNAVITHDEEAEGEFNIDEDFQKPKEYIEKYRDEVVEILYHHDNFNIYLLKDDTVKFWHKNSTSFIEAVNEFERLSNSATALKRQRKITALKMLSSALAAAFRTKALENIATLFEEAGMYINSEVQATLKQRLFYRIMGSALIIISLISLGLITKNSIFNGHTIDVYFYCALSGTLGATVSSLQRMNKISFNVYRSRISLDVESVTRLIIGIVFSLFLLITIKSGIVFSNYEDNIYAIISLAFISGFSERFVPNIISNVEGRGEELNKKD